MLTERQFEHVVAIAETGHSPQPPSPATWPLPSGSVQRIALGSGALRGGRRLARLRLTPLFTAGASGLSWPCRSGSAHTKAPHHDVFDAH
jgi:hypothetical protein